MKRYCFDTSGISTPAEHMPQDIHQSMWRKIIEIFRSGSVAVTTEIFEEMIHIPGDIGACIVGSKSLLVLEVNEAHLTFNDFLRREGITL